MENRFLKTGKSVIEIGISGEVIFSSFKGYIWFHFLRYTDIICIELRMIAAAKQVIENNTTKVWGERQEKNLLQKGKNISIS